MMIKEEAFNKIAEVLDNESKDTDHLIAKFYMIQGIIKDANKELSDVKEDMDALLGRDD